MILSVRKVKKIGTLLRRHVHRIATQAQRTTRDVIGEKLMFQIMTFHKSDDIL